MDTSDAPRAAANLCQISPNRPIARRQNQLCAGYIWRDRSTSHCNAVIEHSRSLFTHEDTAIKYRTKDGSFFFYENRFRRSRTSPERENKNRPLASRVFARLAFCKRARQQQFPRMSRDTSHNWAYARTRDKELTRDTGEVSEVRDGPVLQPRCIKS